MQIHAAFGDFRNQPVLRKPRDADEKTERGREHDAEAGDEQRVEQADDKGAAIGRGLAVGDQRLRNAETGGPVQEAETGRDMACRQIAQLLKHWINPGGQCALVGSKLSASGKAEMGLTDIIQLSPRVAGGVRHLANWCIPHLPA